MKTRAALLWSQPGKFEVAEVELDPPKEHEVLVRLHLEAGDKVFVVHGSANRQSTIEWDIGPGPRGVDHLAVQFTVGPRMVS